MSSVSILSLTVSPTSAWVRAIKSVSSWEPCFANNCMFEGQLISCTCMPWPGKRRMNIQWRVLMGAWVVLVGACAKVFFSLWRVKPELHLGKISVCLFASDKLASLESPMLHKKNSHWLVTWGKLWNVLTMDCLQTLADVYNVFFASFFAKSWALWHFSEVYSSGCHIDYIPTPIPRPWLLFQGLCRTGVLHAHRYLPVPSIRKKDESPDLCILDFKTCLARNLEESDHSCQGAPEKAHHPCFGTDLFFEVECLEHKFNRCDMQKTSRESSVSEKTM